MNRLLPLLLGAWLLFLFLRPVLSQAAASLPPLGVVRALAFSPDGQTLASGGDDTTIKLWNPRTGRRRLLIGHVDAVTALAWAQDGRRLVSAGADRTIKVWDMATGKSRLSWEAGADQLAAVAVSPDGILVAAEGKDHAVSLWSARDGHLVTTLPGPNGAITALDFSPDGRLLAGAGQDQTVRVWSVETKQCLQTLKQGGGWVLALRFTPDSRTVITGGDDQTVSVWDAATGRRSRALKGHTDIVAAVAPLPDGRILSGGYDGTVSVWGASGDKPERLLSSASGWVRTVAASTDGAQAAWAGDDGSIHFLDLRSLKGLPQTLQDQPDDPRLLAALACRKAYIRGPGGYDNAGAIQSLTSAVRLQPAHADYAVCLAGAYEYDRRYAEAMQSLQRAMPLAQSHADRVTLFRALADLHNAWGDRLQRQTQYESAQPHLETALALDRRWRPDSIARDLDWLASNAEDMNHPEEAMHLYRQEMALRQVRGERGDEVDDLECLGNLYDDQDNYARAKDYYQRALAVARAIKDRKREAIGLNDLGLVSVYLGQPAPGLLYLRQALSIFQELSDQSNECNTLANIGYTEIGVKQYAAALADEQQALAIAQHENYLSTQGRIQRGIGEALRGLGQYDEADAGLQKALRIARELRERLTESGCLRRLGDLRLDQKRPAEAAGFFQQAALAAREVKWPRGEAIALAGLMRAESAQGHRNLAVFYGKTAINLYQQIRAGLMGLDSASQRDFAQSNEPTYRQLANLLIDQQRLPEAEQVLGMLKDEEFFQYVRGDTKPPPKQTLTGDAADQEWRRRYERNAANVTYAAARCNAILSKDEQDRTTAENLELPGLQKELDDAKKAFTEFLGRLQATYHDAAAGQKQAALVDDDTTHLQGDLATLGDDVAAIYTLVGEDKFRVIVVTGQTRKSEEYPITAEELTQKIALYREALKDPRVDPRSLGKELYEILFCKGAVEQDLHGAGIHTLMWSLDGPLRYLPMAALYDGKQYLVERYANDVFDPESLSRILRPVSPHWQGAGFGVSQKQPDFPALAGVPQELYGIFHNGSAARGVLDGKVYLDKDFTWLQFQSVLRRPHPLIHIASHFAFQPGHENASFLLLGNNDRKTIDDIRGLNNAHPFLGVQLLTLSACDTASGGVTRDGREVEGLNRVVETLGADAVLATLWPVSDASTQQLMRTFYAQREGSQANSGVSKADALQAAQLSLLRGSSSVSLDAPERDTDEVPSRAEHSELPAFPSGQPQYAHPFYWAPFILTGNWR